MPDARLTGAKNVIESSAENSRFASCGALRQRFDPDKLTRAQYFCMAAGRPVRDVTALLRILLCQWP